MKSKATPLKIGAISFAMYHGNFWAQAVNASDKAELVGIWDDDPARGQQAADTYATRFFSDLDELLTVCDAVTITSETLYHVDYIEAAAKHGCHILCEKPITTLVKDCDRVEAVVTEAGVIYMQSYPKRFDPANIELKRMIDAGELGDITFVRVRHGHYYGLMGDGRHAGWPDDPIISGGGSLLDEGTHGADLIRWFFGDPHSVTAVISYRTLKHDVEDLGVALYTYEDGPLCELSSSCTFIAGDNSIEVWGTKGTAILSGVDLASRDLVNAPYLKVCKLTEECREHPANRVWIDTGITPGFQDTPTFHQQNVVQFIDAIVEGKPPPVTIEDGRKSLQMVLSAYDSAQSGRVVQIPYDR